jgi:gliding motility-associated-like protein
VLVTKEGITYQLFTSIEDSTSQKESLDPHLRSKNSRIKGHIVNANFGSASFNKFTSSEIIPTRFQYLKGKDQSKWTTRVNAWKQLTFHEIYDGISLKLYFEGATLKYDFILQENANIDDISIRYDGAKSISIESGFLAIETSIGTIYEKPPFSYQIIENKKNEVKCQFRLEDKHIRFKLTGKYDQTKPLIIDPELIFSTYSGSRADNFGNTATYDDAGHLYSGGIVYGDAKLPTIPGPFDSLKGGLFDAYILKYSPDGSQLLSAVYLGGSQAEYPISMIVNKDGNLAILGITGSSDFPVTNDAFDKDFNGGSPISPFEGFPSDTYFPEIYYNYDQSVNDYVPQTDFRNGSDIFIAIIDMTNQILVSSTFFGGTNTDGYLYTGLPNVRNYGDQLRGEIMTDASNNIYIASHTNSDTLDKVPVLGLNYHVNHGFNDALVAKFNPSLTTLEWVRFLGGVGRDCGFGIRVDTLNQVYVTGGTNSSDMFGGPATGLEKFYKGVGNGLGRPDGYIAKISADGTQILNSTFLGTTNYDQSYFIDLDKQQDVYVFGQTQGAYPVTSGVYSNPNSGQFIHKLDNNLAITRFSTVFGSGSGSPDISPTAFLVNDCRKIFISGWGGRTNRNDINEAVYKLPNDDTLRGYDYRNNYLSGSTANMPVTKDAFQKTSTGSGFYFAILQPESNSLAYATHFAASVNSREHVDGGTSRFDKKGIIYQSVCAGCGGQTNFPTPNPNVWSLTNNSDNCNNAAIKFDLGKVVAKFETFDSLTAIPSKYGCVPITFRIKNNSSGATNYKWEVGSGILSFKDDSIYIKFTERGFQKITLIAFDTSICRLVDTARSTVNAGDVKVDFVPDIKQCGLASVIPNIKLYTPWAKVTWTPTDGLSDPTIANPVISYTGKDQTYFISVTDDTLCQKFDTLSVKIRDPNPKTKLKVWNLDIPKEQYSFCYPNHGFLTTKSTLYDYIEWTEDGILFNQGVDSSDHDFPYPGKIKYEVSIYDSVCNKSATDARIVTLSQLLPTYPVDTVICPNNLITSKVIGDNGFTYLWKPEILFPNPKADIQTFLPKGNERISIIVTDTIGCVDSSGYNINILESIQAILDKEYKYCRRKADGIEIYSNTLSNYLWEPSGYTGNPLKVTASGTYFLTGLDLNNCPVKDTVKVIERCDPELYVPNAFSPNGDGQNDFFEVFGYDVSQFDINIFDRWGEIIYHSTDFKFNWDGKYKGQIVQIGTYPFVISYKGTTFEGESVSKTFSGDVTVVR